MADHDLPTLRTCNQQGDIVVHLEAQHVLRIIRAHSAIKEYKFEPIYDRWGDVANEPISAYICFNPQKLNGYFCLNWGSLYGKSSGGFGLNFSIGPTTLVITRGPYFNDDRYALIELIEKLKLYTFPAGFKKTDQIIQPADVEFEDF